MRVIYVMDRGIVKVGVPREQRMSDGLFIVLDKCATIRRWGTTKGLGQLALSGPTRETVLDQEPDGTEVNIIHVFSKIPCPGWKD